MYFFLGLVDVGAGGRGISRTRIQIEQWSCETSRHGFFFGIFAGWDHRWLANAHTAGLIRVKWEVFGTGTAPPTLTPTPSGWITDKTEV